MNAEELERISVLVVDDNEDLREIVVTYFRDAGFSVLDAQDIKGAIHMVRLGIVDVIVTDFDMPGGTGLDLMDQVRAEEKDIPVFLMTGDPALSESQVREQGGAGLFKKPAALGHGMALTVKNYLLVKPSL